MLFRRKRPEGLGLIDLARAPGIEAAFDPDARENIQDTPAATPSVDASQALFDTLNAVRRDLERLRSGHQPKHAGPVQDEWGLFDPARAGMAAALARLEEIGQPQGKDPKSDG